MVLPAIALPAVAHRLAARYLTRLPVEWARWWHPMCFWIALGVAKGAGLIPLHWTDALTWIAGAGAFILTGLFQTRLRQVREAGLSGSVASLEVLAGARKDDPVPLARRIENCEATVEALFDLLEGLAADRGITVTARQRQRLLRVIDGGSQAGDVV